MNVWKVCGHLNRLSSHEADDSAGGINSHTFISLL